VVALSRQEIAKENFYDSHRICDMCYLQSLQNPTVLYEFDRCGNIYQNYTTYYWNGTQGILHLKYSDNPNLLWTPRSGDVKSSSGVLIVAIVDWLIIMYFALTSVIQIKRAITLGNKHDLEQAKSYLIHNALLCHMIVFSIANTLWDLDPGDQGCYIAFLPVSYARADILIALVYILVFIVSSCCMAKSKLFTRVHILSLMSYALYSLVASVVSSKLSGCTYSLTYLSSVLVPLSRQLALSCVRIHRILLHLRYSVFLPPAERRATVHGLRRAPQSTGQRRRGDGAPAGQQRW
jgi:hypothetical protein